MTKTKIALLPVVVLTLAACWPLAYTPSVQSPTGLERTVDGYTHRLRAPILGPVPDVYGGPVDWQGNPAIGDPYIDTLNFYALATCESGVPGGDPDAYAPDDPDGGGARFGAYQFAQGTWHYAADLQDDESADPYQDPRDSPLWYQTYRHKRLMLKELIRHDDAWRYPPETHAQTCGERLFDGRPPGSPPRIP